MYFCEFVVNKNKINCELLFLKFFFQAASKYHGEENENEMYAMERKFSMLTEERKRVSNA